MPLFDKLPPLPMFEAGIRRAPKREMNLTEVEVCLALKNALRYLPKKHHAELLPEFLEELLARGRIYGYRFRPPGNIWAKPVDQYEGVTLEGRAFQLMMDNNLDFDVALYPYELVTYGETGQVCQNWMQYCLIQQYLREVGPYQTLAILSGHPLGLFRAPADAPRVMITNGLMVGLYDSLPHFNRAQALGVANYGQMTAGGWMYIGPQGIVHGTYNTLLIAGRLKLRLKENENLRGKLFVSSGLGGMSGAQGKAVKIAGGVGIIAEVDFSRIETRVKQGWIDRVEKTPEKVFSAARTCLAAGTPQAIAFHGNIVDLLEHAVTKNEKMDLLSDQTSCHVVYEGGYCPQGITFEERTRLLETDRNYFAKQVDKSLRAHFSLVRTLVDRGAYFFDYGNSFMKAVLDAGVLEIARNGKNESDGFIFPSYVEELLGPELFDYGYGPFRWVCLSLSEMDLKKTDEAAAICIDGLRSPLRYQDRDNRDWVRSAGAHALVVGSKARILYQDARGRVAIALKFNDMVRKKEVGPILLGRDHHDTGGTDSPFRETANIKDGSQVMADMATINYAGNAARGMSLVALHNGGGVGIGKAINGGFGLVLDGSERVDEIVQSGLRWDVLVGVARRSWAQNPHAKEVISEVNREAGPENITLPYAADEDRIQKFVKRKLP